MILIGIPQPKRDGLPDFTTYLGRDPQDTRIPGTDPVGLGRTLRPLKPRSQVTVINRYTGPRAEVERPDSSIQSSPQSCDTVDQSRTGD